MSLDASGAKKVLLSGASGMLGNSLSLALRMGGANVTRLVRHPVAGDPGPDATEVHWNPADKDLKLAELELLGPLSAAVHLSGANVSARRWTRAYKREMTESRAGSTRLLAETLARMTNPPPVLVTASATGFYGDRGDDVVDEDSVAGHGYFPELCQAWEAASRPAEEAGIRVVHLRFGVVVGNGGAVARLAPVFRLGIGGQLGNGRQWMSWVSETDAIEAALFCLDRDDIRGPVNVTSPNPVTNAEFTRELALALHCATFLPAPAFALRLALGEMADEALLASTRAVPKRLQAAGFRFARPGISEALAGAATAA